MTIWKCVSPRLGWRKEGVHVLHAHLAGVNVAVPGEPAGGNVQVTDLLVDLYWKDIEHRHEWIRKEKKINGSRLGKGEFIQRIIRWICKHYWPSCLYLEGALFCTVLYIFGDAFVYIDSKEKIKWNSKYIRLKRE